MKTKIIKFIPAALFLFSANFACAADYDFYVDAGSIESQEDGTDSFPFKTIGAAMRHIENKDLDNQNVYIKKGVYSESVELTEDTNLIGEDRHETVIDADGQGYGVYFHSSNSQISNLTVKNASTNLKVNKKSKVVISNCSIKDSRVNGIEVDRSSYSKNYKFSFVNSSVKDSGKRGMYIFRREIEISGSEISGSGEEGIDLHSRMQGTIRSNEISGNGESGIEMILAGTNVSIQENNVSGNHTQGVTIQMYDSRKGKVNLTGNDIRSNSGYGIRYARYDHGKIKGKFRNFLKKCVKLKGNSIGGNLDGDYGYQ